MGPNFVTGETQKGAQSRVKPVLGGSIPRNRTRRGPTVTRRGGCSVGAAGCSPLPLSLRSVVVGGWGTGPARCRAEGFDRGGGEADGDVVIVEPGTGLEAPLAFFERRGAAQDVSTTLGEGILDADDLSAERRQELGGTGTG